MQLRAYILLLAVLAVPSAALADGVPRRPPMLQDGSILLYLPKHQCTPGQNATDPDCSEARRLDCLGACRHDYKYSGDRMSLRHCEYGCTQDRVPLDENR